MNTEPKTLRIRMDQSIPLSTGKAYSFTLVEPKTVQVTLQDEASHALAGATIKAMEEEKPVAEGHTGKDGEFHFEYDGEPDSLSISFPSVRVLPEFESLWRNHPRDEDSRLVKKMIGGKVDAEWYVNTCAIRMSRAFNYSGYTIPKLKSRQPDGKERWESISGADGKWYLLRVDTFLSEILEKHFGPPDIRGKVKGDFMGKKGLILFKVRRWEDATGHLDLWDGAKASHKAYFDKSDYVLFWRAKAIHCIAKEVSPKAISLTYRVTGL